MEKCPKCGATLYRDNEYALVCVQSDCPTNKKKVSKKG